MKRWMAFLLIVLLAAAVATEFILPRAVAAWVAHSLSRMTGDSQVSVTVRSEPALQLLAGRFDSMTVEADEAKIDKLTFSRVTVTVERAQLDVGALYARRELAIKSAADIDLMAVVSQEELARYLNRDVKGVRNAQVTVTPEKTLVSGELGLPGVIQVAVNLEGRIAADGQQIKFVTQRLGVTQAALGRIAGTAVTEIPLVDLDKAPFPVRLRQLDMEPGRVVIRAEGQVP